MEDKEFDLCTKECKKYLEKDRLGKIQMREMELILQAVFRQGYELGKNSRTGFLSRVEFKPIAKSKRIEVKI